MARPFTKIMLLIENRPSSTSPLPMEQNPSYVGVETCRDDKAAALSLFVQLPSDNKTGRPSYGRTGLCLGSSLVYVNSSKKPKQRKKSPRSREEGGHRVREENSSAHLADTTGRARLRNLNSSDSQLTTSVA